MGSGAARRCAMKQLFERVSSYWVRYDKYEIRTDSKGTKYITAAVDAKSDIFDPLADAQTMVLEALNVTRHFIIIINKFLNICPDYTSCGINTTSETGRIG